MEAIVADKDRFAANEQSIVARARGGDADALTQLIATHSRDMTRLTYLILLDAQLAQDAAQRAWIRAWMRFNTLRDPSRVRAWLLSIAANEARMMLRARHSASRSEARVAVKSADAPDGAVDRLDLAAALARLSAPDRELLALRYGLGLTGPEIAAQLRSSPGAIRNRLSRLVKALREELRDV